MFFHYREYLELHRKIYMEPKCNDAKEFMIKIALPSKPESREGI